MTCITDYDRFDATALALLQPDTARRLISEGLPHGPLRGVPFLLKDLGAEAIDFPLHNGSELLRDTTYPRNSALYDQPFCLMPPKGRMLVRHTGRHRCTAHCSRLRLENPIDCVLVSPPRRSPVGVQLAAGFGEDEMLMSLCGELEAAQPWFHRRPAMVSLS